MADFYARNLPVTGLDLSPAMGRLARRRLRSHGFCPRLVRGRAQSLPLADSSLSNVVATFPTEFILSVETLSEVARVIRPGGRFLIVLQGYLKGPYVVRCLIERAYQVTGQRYFPGARFENRLEQAGFAVSAEEVSVEGADAFVVVAVRR